MRETITASEMAVLLQDRDEAIAKGWAGSQKHGAGLRY